MILFFVKIRNKFLKIYYKKTCYVILSYYICKTEIETITLKSNIMTTTDKINALISEIETTTINYGKVLTVVQSKNGGSRVFTLKIGQLSSFVSNLEAFTIRVSTSKIAKTVKALGILGISVEVDDTYGFEWEAKLYCNR